MLVRRLEELWNGGVEMDVIRNAFRSALLLQAMLWSVLLLYIFSGSSQSDMIFYTLWGVYPAFVVFLFISNREFFSRMVVAFSFIMMILSFSVITYANDFLFGLSFFGLAVFFWLLLRPSIGLILYFFSFVFLPFFGILLIHRHVLKLDDIHKRSARDEP